MNFELLSPHQFEDYRDYVDTVLVCGDTGVPLDIASPLSAARLISHQLAYGVLEKYRGRSTLLDVGSSMWYGYDVAYWATLANTLVPFSLQYGILITDRLYLREKITVEVNQPHTKWFIFDWHHWLRNHIPQQRVVDSFLYLCMASDLYRASPECKNLGISMTDQRAMADEGTRILKVMSSELITGVSELWQVNPSEANGQD